MNSILQPFLNNKHLRGISYNRFTTENRESLKDRGQKQRLENTQLEKDDLRFTRRILENNNNKSLSTSLHITKALRARPEACKQMKKYVKGSVDRVNGRQYIREPIHDFEWTPCRFEARGWKFLNRGAVQKHLHHHNKINYIGTRDAFKSMTKQSILNEYKLPNQR